METYAQKVTRVTRRQEELDHIRRNRRTLTEEEVKEYFRLNEELRRSAEAGSSDEEEPEPLEGSKTRHYIYQPDDIPAWTGARVC